MCDDTVTWVPKDVTEAIHECRVKLSGELLERLRGIGWQPTDSVADGVLVNWMLDHGTIPPAPQPVHRPWRAKWMGR